MLGITDRLAFKNQGESVVPPGNLSNDASSWMIRNAPPALGAGGATTASNQHEHEEAVGKEHEDAHNRAHVGKKRRQQHDEKLGCRDLSVAFFPAETSERSAIRGRQMCELRDAIPRAHVIRRQCRLRAW